MDQLHALSIRLAALLRPPVQLDESAHIPDQIASLLKERRELLAARPAAGGELLHV